MKLASTILIAIFASAPLWAGSTPPAGSSTPVLLRFSPAGTFKIVQFTDPHVEYKDYLKGADNHDVAQIGRAATRRAAVFAEVNRILDLEKPDLVVFTGDNVMAGPDQSFEYWRQLTKPMADRHIPWAAVMGNHDGECTHKSNREILAFLETLPASVARRGPDELGGGGNYVLTIAGSRFDQPRAAVFCFDSGSYADRRLCDGYAWVSFATIAWFRQQAQALAAANGGQPLPALAFFHIPTPEFEEVLKAGKLYGAKKEAVCCPKVNSGLFAAFLESRSVLGAFVGHDHTNDYAASLHGICLAYGRRTGPQSGARVIELTEGSRAFSTWIRGADGAMENRIRVPDAFAPSPVSTR